ncbi:sacsin N-terminal ATP-binding-like domain-containing protein [Sorangium sp. So ce1024]|uniref:sacsin N-terminal ATP-binding-like domain-containing protein n=1 Tax=Sorangium sp. So ce1024 TaxID=3133327 RepID=UPI003F09DF58
MAPYRSFREDRAAAAAPPPGPVADMVQQFADPYAFLRELVQNGMDAGARSIAVRVETLPGACATSVTDDGSGMSREDIEGPLLTLFSSSKEGDASKIGKYGVGFVSVFAIQPEQVDVETWRDGQAFRLRLRGDTSYELEDAGRREGSGTRITLLQRLNRKAFVKHARRTQAALRRWCRHAQCEITLTIADHEGSSSTSAIRIDTPLSVAAPVSVTAATDEATFVVGPSAGAQHLEQPAAGGGAAAERGPAAEHRQSFAGFYNRGLTLFETADEIFTGLSGVRFKVMSPRLQHTLSRDNVRRDDAFWEALARVRELVKGPLRRELAARLPQAAAAAAAGEGAAAYAALLEAALTPPTALDPDEIPFPLASPVEGDRTRAGLRALAPGREPLLVAARGDALTEAMARGGLPVVLCNHPATGTLLQRCFPAARIEDARAAYLLVREEPESAREGDAALLCVVAEALARARHSVARVSLCRIEGALRQRGAILLPGGGERGAPHRSCHAARDVVRRAARFRPGNALYLNIASDTVALARRRAAVDPVTAGNLLARALLVEAKGPLAPDDSDRLLDLGASPPPLPGGDGRAPRGLPR